MKWTVAICTIIGGFLASWLGPKIIVWYATPSVDIGVTCERAVADALYHLQLTQTAGTALGFVAGLIIYYVFVRKDDDANLSVE